MCIHASWLTSDLCTRCNLRPQPPSPKYIEKGSPKVKRVSLLPSRVIGRIEGPQPQVGTRCVGCRKLVNPAFSYTGSVLSDLIHSTLKGSDTTPILGTVAIQVFTPPPSMREVVVGGATIETSRRIAFRRREKGYICDGCASNITTVEGKDGERIPVVITDPKGNFNDTLGGSQVTRQQVDRECASVESESPAPSFRRSKPAFNTRVTQGRKGKRV